MKNKALISILTAAAMALSLAACSGTAPASSAGNAEKEDAAAVETTAEAVDSVETKAETEVTEAAAADTAGAAVAADTAAEAAAADGTAAAQTAADVDMVMNGDLVLPVPTEYMDLMLVETPENSEDGILFRFTEKASVDQAKAMGDYQDGMGWLFDIGRVSEEQAQEMLCSDMSGMDLIAKDDKGDCYILYHPTDVRVVRENMDDLSKPDDPWNLLHEWVANVPDSFVAENAGMTRENHTNTSLDIYLARIRYKNDVNYELRSLEYGAMTPGEVDPAPYVERLTRGAAFYYADLEEGPDGEYDVLAIPEDKVRYEFFPSEGNKNLVREVHENDEGEDDFTTMYEAVFEDGTTTAYDVINEWYHALAGVTEGGEAAASEAAAAEAAE